jgi:hypothetical protein
MADRTVDANFWTAPDWNTDISNAVVPGFAFFTDGDMQYAVTRANRCQMDVIHRTAKEFFSKTAEDSCAAVFPSAAINGSFGDASAIAKGFQWASSDSLDPDILDVMGDVVIGRAKSPISNSRSKRAFLAYDVASAPVSGKYQFGVGDPPADARAALGGLGPVIIAGQAFSANKTDANFHPWYFDQATLAAVSGKVLVAISPDEQFLLLLAHPHASSSPLKLDAVRDKLVQAGTQNAVFLDGSDSVMLFVAGDWKIRQGGKAGSYKDRVTSIGLRFHFQSELA